jgi:hypothetical protein
MTKRVQEYLDGKREKKIESENEGEETQRGSDKGLKDCQAKNDQEWCVGVGVKRGRARGARESASERQAR